MIKNKNTKRARPSGMKSTPLIILGGGLLLLILFLASFFPMTWKVEEEPYILELEQRIASLEQHMASVSEAGGAMGPEGGLGRQVDHLNTSWQRLDASLTLKTNLLAERLDKLDARLAAMETRMNRPQLAVKEKPKVEVEKKPEVRKKAPAEKPKAPPRYHIVTTGDTAYSISKTYGISLQTLKKLNGFKENTTIYPGQKIMIKP